MGVERLEKDYSNPGLPKESDRHHFIGLQLEERAVKLNQPCVEASLLGCSITMMYNIEY
jgi:hypothetical protein